MEQRIEDIFARATKVSLTADEKAAGREMLRSFMALRPIRPMVASPTFAAVRRLSFGAVGKPAAVFATVLGMLLSAGGVSYAAEGAVPGDTLYPVKVSVNEEVRAALAPTPKAKAEWEAERAERRLAEAETLAKRGTLEASTSARLAADFRAHAENAQRGMAELRSGSDDDGAADVGAHLEGALQAHKRILAELHDDETVRLNAAQDAQAPKQEGDGKQDGGSKDDGQAIAALVASVDTESVVAVKERKRAEEDAAKDQNSDRAKKKLQARHDAAEKKIAEARATLADMQDKLGAEATAQAESRLSAADGLVASADAKAAAGDSRSAFDLYLRAQRTAQEAKLLIKAKDGLRLKIDLGAPEQGSDRNGDDADAKDGQGGSAQPAPDAQKPDAPNDGRRQGRGDGSSDRRDGSGDGLRIRLDGSLELH